MLSRWPNVFLASAILPQVRPMVTIMVASVTAFYGQTWRPDDLIKHP